MIKRVMDKKSQRVETYVYEIKVTLQGLPFPVWRTLLLEKNTSLGKLHEIIQTVMGWENEHLHLFKVGKRSYGPADNDERMPGEKNEDSVDIQKLTFDKIRTFEYEYDLGDGWQHTIEIVRRVPQDPSTLYPICIGGERACPPEDSGGAWGYLEKLEALKNRKDPDHEEIKEWMGDFDPDYFDPNEVNENLQEEELDREVEELSDEMVDTFASSCAYCGSVIGEKQEVFSLGSHITDGLDVGPWEGEILPFRVEGLDHPVLGAVVPEGSDAKNAGNDLVFQLCSERCAKNLKEALTPGFSLFVPEEYLEDSSDPMSEPN
jgi:hypothetical protein